MNTPRAEHRASAESTGLSDRREFAITLPRAEDAATRTDGMNLVIRRAEVQIDPVLESISFLSIVPPRILEINK